MECKSDGFQTRAVTHSLNRCIDNILLFVGTLTVPCTSMNLTIFITLAVSALLSACSTPEQQAQYERNREQREAAEEADRIKTWTDRCAGYGHQRGTSAMANCVQSEAHAYAGRVQQGEEDRQAGIRANLCLMGNKEFCANKPVQTTCRKDSIGRVNCTSQ